MSSHGLPGFDAWLTHNPAEDGPEPTVKDFEQAKQELGPRATDAEIDDRAYIIMDRRLEQERYLDDLNQAEARSDD